MFTPLWWFMDAHPLKWHVFGCSCTSLNDFHAWVQSWRVTFINASYCQMFQPKYLVFFSLGRSFMTFIPFSNCISLACSCIHKFIVHHLIRTSLLWTYMHVEVHVYGDLSLMLKCMNEYINSLEWIHVWA